MRYRVLVTGAGGFVGGYLLRALESRLGENAVILGTCRTAETDRGFSALDVTDPSAVDAAIESMRPTHVVNLAGVAAPRAAEEDPLHAWQVNFTGTLSLGNSILRHAPSCTFLAIGSGLCYGSTAKKGIRLKEDAPLRPVGAYQTSKAAGDLAAGALALEGLRCVRLRPFNHTGAGQLPGFVAPDFAMQIARIEAGQAQPVVRVGNLDAERDFLDVRDVADSYAAVVERADDIQTGTALNIASGKPVRIRELLDRLLALSTRHDITVESDPSNMRPAEIPYFVGDGSAAERVLGWKPQRKIEETLTDLLDWCRGRL